MSKQLRIEYLHGEIRDVTVTAAMTAREFEQLNSEFVVAAYTEQYGLSHEGYIVENLPDEPPGYKYHATDGAVRYIGAEETVYVNFVDDAAIADLTKQLKDLRKQHAIKPGKARPEGE